MWSLCPISETMPVLNLSVRNSKEPILKASPGTKLCYSFAKSSLYKPHDFDVSNSKF